MSRPDSNIGEGGSKGMSHGPRRKHRRRVDQQTALLGHGPHSLVPGDTNKAGHGHGLSHAGHVHHRHHNEWERQRTHHPGMRVRLALIPGLTPHHIMHHHHRWYFQCPPMDPFTITYGHDSQEYETLDEGTYSTAAAAKLDIIQFKTLFVDQEWGFELYHDYDINDGRDLLKHLSKSGAPFHLTCVHHHGDGAEYSGPVTLTDYVHTESEPFAYYADVTFKQYRDSTVNGRTHKRHGGRHWPKHHKLTAHDTLYSLAKHYYGRASAARLIAHANHIRATHFHRPIVKLPKWHVGSVIKLPKPPHRRKPDRIHKVYDRGLVNGGGGGVRSDVISGGGGI